MKTTLRPDPNGLALLWPRIFTAVVLHLRPLMKATPPKQVPDRPRVERLIPTPLPSATAERSPRMGNAALAGCSAPADPPVRPLPSIIRIVLTQLAKLRMRGQITMEKFDAQIRRLSQEELRPRALSLCICHLPNGITRCIIAAAGSGLVRDIIEIAPDGASSASPLRLLSRTAEAESLAQ